MKCYAIENHPNDSRARIDPDGIVQTLSSRMGTGGNNTPFVLITDTKNETYGIEREFVMTKAFMAGNGQLDQVQLDTVSRTLDCMHDQKMVVIESRAKAAQ